MPKCFGSFQPADFVDGLMAGPLVCATCQRWYSTSGAPICGICRIARAISALPLDQRVNNSNFDLATSILERALGEVNSWLSVPLTETPGETHRNLSPSPASGGGARRSVEPIADSHVSSGENSPRSHRGVKDKRSDRHRERRQDRREDRVRPPTPPPPPRRSSQRSPTPTRFGSEVRGRCHKKNKGKKHREQGVAFREAHRAD